MDTNDQIRSTLIKGLINPWSIACFLLGCLTGYAGHAVKVWVWG